MRPASLYRGRVRAVTAAALGCCLLTAASPASAADPDVTPPVISSTGIEPGSLAPAVLLFKPTVTDNRRVRRIDPLVNGVLAGWCDPLPAGAWSCGATLSSRYAANDSDAEITLRAFDFAGNQSEASTLVHVDNVRPTATITPAATTRVFTRSGTLPITFSDVPADLASITTTDGTSVTAAPWQFDWKAANGAPSPCFTLRDRAGNSTEACSGYVVDDDPPVIREVVSTATYTTTPLAGGNGWLGGLSHISAPIDDVSPTSLEWWSNDVLLSTKSGFDWDTRAITTPTVTLELRVRDAVGNVTSASYVVHVDNKGPVFTSILPAHHALVHGSTFTTSINVHDPAGIADSNLTGGDALPRPPYVYSNGTVKSGKDGVRRVTWRVVDKLGNETYASRDVIVDNTLPDLRVTKAPKNNTKLAKPVAFAASASDRNGIANVQLLVNGKIVATDTKAAYSFTLDPKKYGKTFAVQLRAVDRAGNVRSTGKMTYRR